MILFIYFINVSYRQNKLLCTLPRLSVYGEYYSKTIRLFVLFSLTQVHKYYIIKKYKYTTVKKKKNLCNHVHCTLLTVHQSSVCPTVCLLISLSIWECPVSGHHSWGYLLRSLGQCLRYDWGRLYLTYGTSTSSPSVSLQHSSSTKAFTWLGIFFLETLLTTSDNLQFNITFWSKSEWTKLFPH